jgi:hypothetical protein
MKKQNFGWHKSWLFILLLPLVLSGCVINIKKTTTTTTAAEGGIFRSDNLGETWSHVTSLYTSNGKPANFNGANIISLVFDPSDPATIYLGTQNNGIFYSYNYGNGWFNVLQDKGAINSLVVDPNDKCTIYAAAHNAIYKTTDCSRTWKKIYFETLAGKYITALDVKGDDSRIVYAGTSGGSFLKSQDAGYSWDVIKRFNNNIKNLIVLNGTNSNIIYLATQSAGIWRSVDGGANWDDLRELKVAEAEVSTDKLKTLKQLGDNSILAFARDRSLADGLIYVNKIGIFRLANASQWQQIKLLTPKRKDTIYSVTVNPKNTKEIFYGTALAFYHSIDNGLNWVVTNLPTTASAKLLDFSLDNKFLYFGAFIIKQ